MARRADPERIAQRRAEMTAAAAHLFATQGYERTSVAQVAEAVGTSPASVFYYFDDKTALFRAMFEQDLPLTEALIAAHRDADDPLDAVLKILEGLAEDAASKNAAGILVETLRRVEHDPELVALIERTEAIIRDGLASLIARGIAVGSIDPHLDPTETAVWLQAIVDATYLNGRPGHAPQAELRRTALGYLTTPRSGGTS